jgi:hypothetical protein
VAWVVKVEGVRFLWRSTIGVLRRCMIRDG